MATPKKRVLRADTNEPVNLLSPDGIMYLPEAPKNGKEYAWRNEQWVDISEELKMARWFAKTDRVITNTTIPAITQSSGSPLSLEVTVRRVKVGNVYLYRGFVNGPDVYATIVVGDYVLATSEDYPELVNYEFSNQMSLPIYCMLPGGGIAAVYTLAAALIQPNGFILHVAQDLHLGVNYSLIFEATRSQMGPWAL